MYAYSSTLSIGRCGPQHNGNYTCMAKNSAAVVNYTAEFIVNVPPYWVIEPVNNAVKLHRSVMMDCQAFGMPLPEIRWKKAAKGETASNYVPISFSDRTVDDKPRHVFFQNGSLLMREVQEADHGYYLCHASNGVGSGLSKVLYLTVHVPARFDIHSEKNYTVAKARNISMKTDAIGDVPMSISWRFNGEKLLYYRTNRMDLVTYNFERGKSSKLQIKRAIREDSGFYEIMASNDYGIDHMVIHLLVLEQPDPPLHVNVADVMSTTVEISWEVNFDGNSPITRYIIQYKQPKDMWSRAVNTSVPHNITKTSVQDLHPAYSYNIRVLAANNVGTSAPQAAINVTMQEEAPSGFPINIKIIAITSERLNVTWQPPEVEKQNGQIIGYFVKYKRHNSSENYLSTSVRAPKRFVMLDNLKKFTPYSVTVQAATAKGNGPPSPAVVNSTLEDVPSQPPRGVSATAVGSTIIKIFWEQPEVSTLHGTLRGYKVIYKPVRTDEDERYAQVETVYQGLRTDLKNLEKFTNYSLEVLAFTKMGEGVRSKPLYVMTGQDIPSAPADIKVIPINSTSLLVSWKEPVHKNGIISKYTIHMHPAINQPKITKIELKAPCQTYYIVNGLSTDDQVEFHVTASTIVGEGPATVQVSGSPSLEAGAKIATFPQTIVVPSKHHVTLPCHAVGDPIPTIKWKKSDGALQTTNRYNLLSNGSLEISHCDGPDAAIYTCVAMNKFGVDEIAIKLVVLVKDRGIEPNPPVIRVAVTTLSSIQVNWRTGSNGGSPILGFYLEYKKLHNRTWEIVKLNSRNRSFTAGVVLCGTRYQFRMKAFNVNGNSSYTKVIEGKTNGTVPIPPAQSLILKKTGISSINLNLSTWLADGCKITAYGIQLREWPMEDSAKWRTIDEKIFVRNNFRKVNLSSYVINDLHPESWYQVKVFAYSDPGYAVSRLKFKTLSLMENIAVLSTLDPVRVMHQAEAPKFYQQVHVMVPTVASVAILIVALVGVTLFCRRRAEIIRLKESSGNLRRDLTVETSLMNDLDKRLSTNAFQEMPYTPEPSRNVNLHILDQSIESINDDNSNWLCQSYATSTSENASTFNRRVDSGTLDSDGNINPYATFHYVRNQRSADDQRTKLGDSMLTFRPPLSEEPEDSVYMEKKQAQREAIYNDTGVLPPPPPALLSPPVINSCYQNQRQAKQYLYPGILLSPRKYASADAINALFNGRIPPYHLPIMLGQHGTSRPVSRASCQACHDKGQRHSRISSITTVSSNHEELLQAFENSRCHTLTPAEFDLSKDSVSLSQGTDRDSSDITEPGIRQFTQTPPWPEERRQAACEVPYYEKPLHPHPQTLDLSSATDTTPDYEVNNQRRKSPYRKTKPRKGRQRGQLITKNKVIKSSSRGPCRSRPSSSSTSEETTYTFEDEFNPRLTNKTPDIHYATRRRGRKCTPHKYYDLSAETPGTDEHRPLVLAGAKVALSSPLEEDETVNLLDRYGEDRDGCRGEDELCMKEDDDEIDLIADDDYTDRTFAIV